MFCDSTQYIVLNYNRAITCNSGIRRLVGNDDPRPANDPVVQQSLYISPNTFYALLSISLSPIHQQQQQQKTFARKTNRIAQERSSPCRPPMPPPRLIVCTHSFERQRFSSTYSHCQGIVFFFLCVLARHQNGALKT